MTTESVLRIENIYSHLLTTDVEFKKMLSKLLRFRPKNYFHNAAYRNHRWDGWDYFFDEKSGKFLTGILPEIKLALRKKNKPFREVDLRPPFHWQHTNIDQDFLNQWLPPGFDPIKLHDYQPDLANQCFRHLRGIVPAPTGAGKTFILVSLLKSLPPKTPTLFLTKNASLVHQNWVEMQTWGVPNLGRWYGDYKEKNYVMCATVHKNTFESLAPLLPKFQVLLVDEVHECMSKVPVAAYRKMKGTVVRIGFSATSMKWDKKKIDDVHKWNIKGFFGPLFKTTTVEGGILKTKDLQERNILSASECFFYPIDKPDLKFEDFQQAVKLGIEQNFYFHDVVARLAKNCPGRTLIVVERIEQGNYLKALIPNSSFIHGKYKLKDRLPVLEALKKGDKTVAIVMKQIITAGINVKIHDLINAAGGEAAHNMIQLMGRGLRTAEDKDKLRYHDFRFVNNDYLLGHSDWRAEVLRKEGHEVSVLEHLPF